MYKYSFFLFLLVLLVACKKEETALPVPAPEHTVNDPIDYKVEIPAGKRPWPQHKPDLNTDVYQEMLDELWVINNFGQYQCGDTPEQCYFHDALDIVLNNGTPIYAVDSGYVVAKLGSPPYYKTLIIADANDPEYGWSYTHVYNFKVGTGEFVAQGQEIGVVSFQGLEHIHLSRVKKDPDWANYQRFVSIMPDEYFVIDDSSPPVIKTPFYYFENESDTRFDLDSPVKGAVDIVVGIRDPGAYSGSPMSNYGNRLCIKRLHYRILKDGIVIREQASFDFSKITIRYSPQRYEELLTVYKFHEIFYGADQPENWDKFVSHYIITNTDGVNFGEIEPSDGLLSWNTAERDELDNPVFPNGNYVIEIEAYDTHDNKTVAVDSVWVEN